jgi:penicillin-binding protein 1A
MTIRADLDHAQERRRRRRRAVVFVTAGAAALVVLLLGVWLWRYAFADLPPTPDATGIARANRPPSVVFLDRNGTEIGRRGPNAGEVLRLADLPAYTPRAFLAAEDRRFYGHGGIDALGVARAAWVDLRERRIVEGGSTITQQIARTLFLSPEQTVRRKLQEAVLALRIEDRMGKDDILKLYLNRIYFGAGAYGIEAAARTYFGKPARSLTLSEAALLAALPKAPSRLDPTNNFAAALTRSRLVLARMRREGWISAAEEAEARRNPPVLAREPEREEAFGYVLDRAASEVRTLAPRATQDLVVRLSIDADLQREAQAAVRETVAQNGGLGATQAALIALGRQGAILALVGGVDHRDSPFDRSVQALRQPGSAFKPFVYAAALDAGVGPGDVRRDAPVAFGAWRPKNAGGGYAGEVTVTQALARSINTVSVKLADEAGPERVARLARSFGMGSIPPRPNLSIALGTYEVRLVDLVSAYQVFQQGGFRHAPHLIEQLALPDGRILWTRPAIAPAPVYDAARARQMVAMMQTVIDEGTGRRAGLGRPAAGKTGTTQNNRDAWFVGFTPDVTAGVWVGDDAGRSMQAVAGADAPALLWRRFMLRAHAGLPVRGFDDPPPAAPAVPRAKGADDPRVAFYGDLARSFAAVAEGGEP